MPEALSFAALLDRHWGFNAGGSHVIDGAFVNWEEAHGRPVFGHLLAMVARLASGMADNPGPKNSTNFETTPSALSSSVMRSTMSVAVASLGSSPVRRMPMTSGRTIDTLDQA